MEILFAALESLQAGLQEAAALRTGKLLVFGAIPFILYALTLLFELRAFATAVINGVPSVRINLGVGPLPSAAPIWMRA